MEDELAIYASKTYQLKEELSRVQREHQDLKKKYYEQQRKERLAGNQEIKSIIIQPPQLPRFTGGGFNLNL